MSIRAVDMLFAVERRSVELRQRLQERPPVDPAMTLALFSAGLSASATLTTQNLTSLAAAIRSGRLPRRDAR